jgi:CheY-like chemotaxis protein
MAVTSYSLRKSNVELKVEMASGLPRVWANEDELNQVVTNLVVNAQQAITERGDGGRLKLVSAYDDVEQTVLLSVSDNGPGIPEEIRTRIFEPFFTTKEVGQGTGIGLAVCHRIMESLQGSIRVSSHNGQGAAFTLSLPAVADEKSTVIEQASEPAKTPTCRVLVVDNEPEITSMLKEILTLDGHEVRCATSAKKALKLLSRHDFQIILMDLRMPEIDGISLYKTLTKLSPRLLDRIGFITGDTFSLSASEFMKQAERPYIEKPFTPDQVRRLVEELLSRVRVGALVS